MCEPLIRRRQIESVVEEKGWPGAEQLNQESSKGGELFRNSPNFLFSHVSNVGFFIASAERGTLMAVTSDL